MKPFLLDANVLISLLDRDHQNYEAAHRWFVANAHAGWATCPLTENAVVRILGLQQYPNSSTSPSQVIGFVRSLRQNRDHRFWPDDLSLTDLPLGFLPDSLSPKQVTDFYLLHLAASHSGVLASFDRRMRVLVSGALANSLHLIET